MEVLEGRKDCLEDQNGGELLELQLFCWVDLMYVA